MAKKHNPSVDDIIAAYTRQVDRFEKQMDGINPADPDFIDANSSRFRRIYRGLINFTKKTHLYEKITESWLFKVVAETGLFYALGRRK